MATVPEPIRPSQLVLERGRFYKFHPHQPVFCLQCVSEITQEMDGKLMIYLGVLDEIQHVFVYEDPPKCGNCGFVFRWHIDHAQPPIDVTAEFQNIKGKGIEP